MLELIQEFFETVGMQKVFHESFQVNDVSYQLLTVCILFCSGRLQAKKPKSVVPCPIFPDVLTWFEMGLRQAKETLAILFTEKGD